MKKLILPILFSSALFFACENNTDHNNNSGENDVNERNTEEHVDQHSMDNISPQLEQNADSASRLEVDPINSANEAEKQK